VLTAVKYNGEALRWASEDCRSDHEIVLMAVQRTWKSIRWAAANCRGDHNIVLTAVKQSCEALRWATESCTSDPGFMAAALKEDARVIEFAADELLLDTGFALRSKKKYHLLKITMMSGRHTIVAALPSAQMSEVIQRCRTRLSVGVGVRGRLVCGTLDVPASACVRHWPRIGRCGEIAEYQLIV